MSQLNWVMSKTGRVVLVAVGVFMAMTARGVDGQDAGAAVSFADLRIDVPDFEAYEVEYTSASGRFFNQVRTFQRDGREKISVLNIIDMSEGVIVDSRGMDRSTLKLEYFMSPYFAWGEEYVVAQFRGVHFDWLRVPLGGGAPVRTTGESEYGGFVGELGFSPSFAALMPLPRGSRFSMPVTRPGKDGTVSAALVTYEVVGREKLELDGGLRCDCWVLEQMDESGGRTRFWVSREAPFLFRRHRDIGGARDFVSDALSFRALR